MRSLFLTLTLTLFASSCEKPKQAPAPPETEPQAAEAPTPPYAEGERRIFDVHTHVGPVGYELMLRVAEQVGIERIVNLSGGSSDRLRTGNLRWAAQTPGRVMLFHNIEWYNVGEPDFLATAVASLEQSYRRGFAGVKVSKSLGLGVERNGELVKVDDPSLDPIWAKAGELGMPVAIHTGDPKAFFEQPTPENERYEELSRAPSWSFYGDKWPSRDELLAARDRLVARHPGTTFILVHLGNNPEDPDYLDQLLAKHPNVVLDTSARVGEFGRHDAKRMKKFFEEHADRILFGTDTIINGMIGPAGTTQLRLTLGSISDPPARPTDMVSFFEKHFAYFEGHEDAIDHPVPIQGNWKVHPVGLGRDVLDKIYFKNAERLIGAPALGRDAARAIVARAAAK